jgi:hypothetical protein
MGFGGGGGGSFDGGGGPFNPILPGSGNSSFPSVDRHRSFATPGTLNTVGVTHSPDVSAGNSSIPSVVTNVRLTALLFGRPSSRLVSEGILPHLNYFNYDTREYFNFQCIGYDVAKAGEPAVATVAGQPWAFSDQVFIQIKDKLQQESEWRYSGGADLIICNELVGQERSSLMLHEGVAVVLDQLLRDEAILNFETFFQGVVDFAKGELGTNNVAAWSDQQGLRLAGSAIRDGILTFLPESVRTHVKQAAHFAVRKIGKT